MAEIDIVPANEAPWYDLQTVFGPRGEAERCQCQWFKTLPVGWCAVEPRSGLVRLRGSRIVWSGRHEDPADDGVWAVTCFVTRTGFRRQGVSRALARAAVGFARERGARAVEGYPMIMPPDREVVWGELYVGSRGVFEDAGFEEVSRPTVRRTVMRIDF